MELNSEISSFFNDNKELLQENSKTSWEEFFSRAQAYQADLGVPVGQITEALLQAGVDPARVMGRIPAMYLFGSDIGSYKVPEGVLALETGCFRDCTELQAIQLPTSLQVVKDGAFVRCGLHAAEFSEGLLSICPSAFEQCSHLETVKLPSSLIEICAYAFADCKRLKSITLGDSVRLIGAGAFQECSKLTEIRLPKSLAALGVNAFLCNGSTPLTIHYEGTQDQWAQICNQGNLLASRLSVTVICADGTLSV